MARQQQYPLRFEPEERAAWQAAADKAGLPLAAWIRAACNVAANHPTDPGTPPTKVKQATCPHPRGERTSYGVCRHCGKRVGR